MPDRVPTRIALLGNITVAAITLFTSGWNSVGAYAMARNTARFSALWCVAALAAPGLGKFIRVLPGEIRMIQAFVAAHAVHFLVVGVLFLTFERPLLVHRPGPAAIVIATGSSLIAALAFTAGAKRPLLVAIRLIALSIASSVFFAAFFRHAVRPLRLIAVALVVAALLRLTRGFTFWTMRTKPT